MITTERFTPATPPPETRNQKPETPQPSTSSPRKGIDLSAIKKKPAAKAEATKPFLPDPTGELATMIERIRSRREEIKGLNSAVETDCAEVALKGLPHYLRINTGRTSPEETFLVACSTGPGLFNCGNRYPKIKDAEAMLAKLSTVLGDKVDTYFRTTNAIKIDCEKIPADKQQEVIDDLVELFSRHGCVDAMEQESFTKQIPDFHSARHSILDVAGNRLLNDLFPIVTTVKTEGVKG